MKEAVETAEEWLSKGDEKRTVVTPNPEIIWMAKNDPDFCDVLNNAGLRLADGIGVVIASRMLKKPLPERVAGYDFLQELLKLGRKTFFFGGKPGVAESAAKGRGNVVGTHHGYFVEEESEDIIKKINDSGAEILVVCLGAPRQEKWIAQYREQLSPTIAIGAGGALDVMAGNVKRAPRWMQKCGLEWLYRALSDPKRIGRLFAIPKFLWAVSRQK